MVTLRNKCKRQRNGNSKAALFVLLISLACGGSLLLSGCGGGSSSALSCTASASVSSGSLTGTSVVLSNLTIVMYGGTGPYTIQLPNGTVASSAVASYTDPSLTVPIYSGAISSINVTDTSNNSTTSCAVTTGTQTGGTITLTSSQVGNTVTVTAYDSINPSLAFTFSNSLGLSPTATTATTVSYVLTSGEVATVTATDADGSNSTEISLGSSSTGGAITLTSSQSGNLVTVTAYDSANPSLSFTFTNSLGLSPTATTANSVSYMLASSEVVTVTATDADGSNSTSVSLGSSTLTGGSLTCEFGFAIWNGATYNVSASPATPVYPAVASTFAVASATGDYLNVTSIQWTGPMGSGTAAPAGQVFDLTFTEAGTYEVLVSAQSSTGALCNAGQPMPLTVTVY